MEIRQILMVALFMFAAMIMKSAMPGQMPVEVTSIAKSTDARDHAQSSKMVTALAPTSGLLLVSEDTSPTVSANSPLRNRGFEIAPVPGSLIALVVAAMGLVSVARRPL